MNRREMQMALSNHLRTLGGPGSGNFDHAGIPGQQGGSAPGDGGGDKSGGGDDETSTSSDVSDDTLKSVFSKSPEKMRKKLDKAFSGAWSEDEINKIKAGKDAGLETYSGEIGRDGFESVVYGDIVGGWGDNNLVTINGGTSVFDTQTHPKKIYLKVDTAEQWHYDF